MIKIMNLKIARFLKIACILLFISLLPVASFYARYEILTNHLEDQLGFEGSSANAVKHAYAAAELYNALSNVLSDKQASSLVMSLGVMNEYIERVTKLNKPDSLREIMKDLHNNQAGIAAAKWREQKSGESDLLDVILKMARTNILIVKRTENPFYMDKDRNDSTVVREARNWLALYHDEINKRIEIRLKE